MTTTVEIIARARLELGDTTRPFTTTTVSDGASTSIELPYHPVEADGLQVLLNGVPTVDFTLDADDGVVTLDAAPAADVVVTVIGQSYWYFLDVDWTTFVREAVTFHLHGRETTLIGLPSIEEPMVAWLAVVEAVWALIGSSVGDIDIRTPEGISIPRGQRVQYLTEYAERLRARYRDHTAQLNIGLHRMEVITTRRIARSTGRLVPVYRSQELEDPAPRERVYPALPKGLLR